jgi:hypothetical protein
MRHEHVCLCGEIWGCTIAILPLPNRLGGARCERWPDSICDGCIQSILQGQDGEERRAIVESMSENLDALTVWRLRQLTVEHESSQ